MSYRFYVAVAVALTILLRPLAEVLLGGGELPFTYLQQLPFGLSDYTPFAAIFCVLPFADSFCNHIANWPQRICVAAIRIERTSWRYYTGSDCCDHTFCMLFRSQHARHIGIRCVYARDTLVRVGFTSSVSWGTLLYATGAACVPVWRPLGISGAMRFCLFHKPLYYTGCSLRLVPTALAVNRNPAV